MNTVYALTVFNVLGSRPTYFGTASNYRPISFNCILCNTLESIGKEKNEDILLENDIGVNKLHGFRPTRYCIMKLVFFKYSLTNAYACFDFNIDFKVDLLKSE